MYPLISLLIGIVLLCAGRSLFWLFVAGAGFLYGMMWAPQWFPHQTELVILAISLGLGLLGALLAVFLQKLAIGIAGALIGGHLLAQFAGANGFVGGQGASLVLFVIGAVLGLIFVLVLFDWALIVLSSLMGASLIVEPWHLTHELRLAAFAVLAAIGIGIQATLFRRRRVIAD